MNESELKSDILLLEKEVYELEKQISDLQNEIFRKTGKMVRLTLEMGKKRLKFIELDMSKRAKEIERILKESTNEQAGID